jgi:sortase B
MKKPWDLAASLARSGDRLLNAAIAFLLILALLFGGFGLWDAWNIYHNAGISDDLLVYKPTATGLDAPNPSLAELQAINPDVCAWLTVDDTNIDYPVVQGESNTEYLNTSVDLEFSLSGSLFLDYRNDPEFTDAYSLIYGHHMEGDVMFGELPYFEEADYFQTHSTGVVFTLEHTYYIEWFACLETDAYDQMIFNPTAYTGGTSNERLLLYLQSHATQYRDGVEVTGNDRLVALSTCADVVTDGRVILVGVIL